MATQKTWQTIHRELTRGDLPGAVRERGAERHVLRFEVSGATYAAFREAAEVLAKQAAARCRTMSCSD